MNKLIDLCGEGDLNAVKLWLEINVDYCNSDYISAFHNACKEGHLEIVQFLLDIKPTIFISDKIGWAFRYACKNGYLKIAKLLLNKYPTIDISIGNEYVFRNACENGHFAISK